MNNFDEIVSLASPFAGVVAKPSPLVPANMSDKKYKIFASRLGNLSAIDKKIRMWNGQSLEFSSLAGAGSDIDEKYAYFKAIAEALERYSNCLLHESEYITASAIELGDSAINWKEIAKPSVSELKQANSTRAFNPNAKIRWIKSLNILTMEQKYVPITITHLYPKQWTSERFYWPISTGTAVHTDIYEAILRGIYEVIERDSIALTWLLKLSPRRINFNEAEIKTSFSDIEERVSNSEEFRYYDVTTDLDIPVIYLRRFRLDHPHATNLVTCACNNDVASAIRSASRESASTSIMFDNGQVKPPENAKDCVNIEDGAAYMGLPKNAKSFEFFDHGGNISFSELAAKSFQSNSSSKQQLVELLRKLKIRNIDVFVSDITTDELNDVGLRSVKVYIPKLMPMSTVSECQYLGHPRIYEYAASMGMGSIDESFLNKEPQPFA